MTLSLQELSDRLEIQDLQTAYSHAIDFKNFDELDDVFTPDAFIDYTVFGGPKGPYPEIKKFLSDTMPMFPAYYHLQATSKVVLNGDTATGVTCCYNPMVMGDDVFTCGLWYHDKYVRTDKGWRIAERIEQKTFVKDMPAGLPSGD